MRTRSFHFTGSTANEVEVSETRDQEDEETEQKIINEGTSTTFIPQHHPITRFAGKDVRRAQWMVTISLTTVVEATGLRAGW